MVSNNSTDRFFLSVEYFENTKSNIFENKGKLHLHDTYTIIYFVEGKGKHRIDAKEYDIKDKSICLLVTGQYHIVNELENAKGYIVQFSDDFLYHQNSRLIHFLHYDILHQYNHLYLSNENIQPVIDKYFELLYNEGKIHDSDLKIILVRQLLICIICRIADFISNKNPKIDFNDNICTQYIKLIDVHYREWHHLEDYIDALNTTRKNLVKRTNERYGKHPIDILHKKYIDHSIVLLLRTERSIKEIAFVLGFSDVSNFCKFFKEKIGLSPSEYRNLYGMSQVEEKTNHYGV